MDDSFDALVELEVTFAQGDPAAERQELVAYMRFGEARLTFDNEVSVRVRLKGGTLALDFSGAELPKSFPRFADNPVVLSADRAVAPGSKLKVKLAAFGSSAESEVGGAAVASELDVVYQPSDRWVIHANAAWSGKVLGDEALCTFKVTDDTYGVTGSFTVHRTDLVLDDWEPALLKPLTGAQAAVLGALAGENLLPEGRAELARDSETQDKKTD